MPELTATLPSSGDAGAREGIEGAHTVDVAIVGAGFAGLYMLYQLRELGFTARIFEAGDDVGGTWYWNRYPGARCDVESSYYSYSFSKELEAEWTWSERYPSQPELLRYIQHVASRFDLRRDIDFGVRVTAAQYDEGAIRWYVQTDRGEQWSAQYVVMAVGCLSSASVPDIAGLDRFSGQWLHTGRWPENGVDLTGHRVAVIGTGSSGIQAIPEIAKSSAQLTVFQRTPNFSLPALNGPLDPEVQERIKDDYPNLRQQARESVSGLPDTPPTVGAFDVDEAERTATYQSGWGRGSIQGITRAYNDLMTSREANETAAAFIRSKIAEIVTDPVVAEVLSPRDHPFGTKRPCLDTEYYQTYNLPHVSLIDLKQTPIVEITERGIRTTAANLEFDTIVFATGYDALTGALEAIEISGRDGRGLKDEWIEGPRSHLGLTIAGFPNLFTITGPGSPSVLSNMVVSIEQHVEWIAECLGDMRELGLSEIEPERTAQDTWVDHVADVASRTLYPSAASWYMGANIPGKPRVFLPYVGGVGAYRLQCEEVRANGYRGFVRR